MDGNFIVIRRKIINWEWYQDTKTKALFFHCLLMANWQDKKWQGQVIKRGQFITSYAHLSTETGLSIRSIRTALEKLKSTNELTIKTTNRNTVITVNNYSQYQDYDKQIDKRTTNERQTNDNQTTTTNKENKENNNNNLSLSKKVTDDERKILYRFAKAQGAKNTRAYVHKLIVNGDYKDIISEEKEKLERKKAKEEYLRKQIEEEKNAVDNTTEEERAEIHRMNQQLLRNLKGAKNDTRIYATQTSQPVRKSVTA